jgi:hypothetical protein
MLWSLDIGDAQCLRPQRFNLPVFAPERDSTQNAQEEYTQLADRAGLSAITARNQCNLRILS